MKYIIADPDKLSGIELKKILDGYKMLVFQGNFTTYEMVEKSIHKEPPDITFIRIGKAELNAFKIASDSRAANPFSKVIFYSTDELYAIQAFEYEADGFLTVPFDNEKIKHLLLQIISRKVKNRRLSL